MTKREFATLCFRLLGLYFVGQSLQFVGIIAKELLPRISQTPPIIYTHQIASMMVAAAPFLCLSTFGLLLLILAPALAAGVAKEEQPFEFPSELVNLRASVFLLAGLLLIGNAVPALISSAIWYRGYDFDDSLRLFIPPDSIFPVAHMCKLIFGIYLLNCSGARWKPVHDWGRDSDSFDEANGSP